MSRDYPRIVEATHMKKWDDVRKKHPKMEHPTCKVCGAPATHRVWVQINWFRGDDEGPFKTCKEHSRDPLPLLSERGAA